MEYTDAIFSKVFPLVASLVLATLPILLEAFRRYLKEKHNFEVSQYTFSRYQELAVDGMQWAEEQARKAGKAKEKLPDGPKKLAMALDYVVEGAKLAGLPVWAEDQIKNTIESALNYERQ